jgi:NAD(P)-dependent dehydrogenase (short-subunit alcohol dehydrogenase family)
MKDLFRLDGKVAVVIGGAGGIGEACSMGLANQGATIVLASRNLGKLEETAAKINAETGAEAIGLQVDGTDEASIQNAGRSGPGAFWQGGHSGEHPGHEQKRPGCGFPGGGLAESV